VNVGIPTSLYSQPCQASISAIDIMVSLQAELNPCGLGTVPSNTTDFFDFFI